VLQGFHARLVELGAAGGARITDVATANARLAPLAQTTTDSHKMLSELLSAWPDEGTDSAGPLDPIRAVVQQASLLREAVGELNVNSRSNLTAGGNHSIVGADVVAHLDSLEARLAAPEQELPLNMEWAKDWNKKAQGLIQRLLEQPAGAMSATVSTKLSVGANVQAAPNRVLFKGHVDPSDAESVAAFLGEIKKALGTQAKTRIHVSVVREDEG